MKNEYLSLDPMMHDWIDDARPYILPVGIGEVTHALGVGKVLVSKYPGFQIGNYVNGVLGMQDYFVGEPKGFYKVDPSRMSLPCYLSALDVTGITAYFTLPDVGRPESSEAVVISGAAGAVDSVAGRIARLKGCRVMDIIGGAKKYRFLVEELDFDGAIDYKNEDLAAGSKCGCLKDTDVFSDNVGGEILDIVLTRTAFKAHIIFCGAISQYNDKEAVRDPVSYLSPLANQAHMEGMVMMNHAQRFPEGLKEMATWLAEGKLQSCEGIIEGLETFPGTLFKLFNGENSDKLVLKV